VFGGVKMTLQRYSKPLRWAMTIMLCVVIAVVCIQLLSLATGSPLPEGRMLSTGLLP
jgi:hypothetical protein